MGKPPLPPMAEIAERDGWSCSYCSIPLVPMDRREDYCAFSDDGGMYLVVDGIDWPERDHVVPQVKGGTDELSNLVLACGTCNNAKSDRDAGEFRRGMTELAEAAA